MRRTLLLLFIAFGIGVLAFTGLPVAFSPEDPGAFTTREEPAEPTRYVAVTIDDLPTVPARDTAKMRQLTEDLLTHLLRYDIPAVGFVNESKLYGKGPDGLQARTALLRQWLDAGLELGNHTYAHRSFQETPLDSIKADILRGEVVTSELLAERGDTIRYFRHPYLRTGPDLETRDAIEGFLSEHGYQVAPVTIDNDEWIYADAYNKALDQGDTTLARRIGEDYVRYMEEAFAFNENLSREVVGREIKQVLLIHANRLNADYMGALAEMMQRRGYQFIPLEEALADSAYRLPDTYAGPRGLSWLQRWAISKGQEPREEPYPSKFVVDIHRAD